MNAPTGARTRYLIVGVFNTAFDIALFSALVLAAHLHPLAANTISTVVVMTVSFFLNRLWVFDSEASGWAAFAQFVTITLTTGILIQSAVIMALLALVDQPVAAKITAIGVGMVLNFLGYRWLFTPGSSGWRSSIANSKITIAKP